MKRRSTRLKTKGIVVLNSNPRPVVTSICDIALGGLSFFYTKEIDGFYNDFTMDVLLYDSLANFEYCITEIKGHLSSGFPMPETTGRGIIWRYGVEFLDMNNENRDLLEKLLNTLEKVSQCACLCSCSIRKS